MDIAPHSTSTARLSNIFQIDRMLRKKIKPQTI